jgi:hypothetical protein
MRAFQVMVCVCSDFHQRGVFIGLWDSSNDLAKAVTHQVAADRVEQLPPPWPFSSRVGTCP